MLFFMSGPCDVMEQFYKGIIGKWPFYGHFAVIPLKFGKNIMSVLYPNLCYNEVCHKGTALYF